MKKLLRLLYLYLSILGVFSFSAFIIEESIQMLTFSMFVVKDTQRWDIALQNINLMRKSNKHLDWIVRYTLWLNPLQQIAYKDFVMATNGYLDSQTALVLANDPGLFKDIPVAFKFYYRSITQDQESYILKTGKLFVRVKTKPIENPIEISGFIIKTKIGDFECLPKNRK